VTQSGIRQETLIVPHNQKGERLDRWLAAALAGRSRAEVQRWIKDSQVTVNGEIARASHRLEPGEQVAILILDAPLSPTQPAAEAIPLSILYEDADLLVIDKPAGMVVHPAPGHAGGTLVNAVLHHCPNIEGVGEDRRPGIVHRLDKETSGVIVVAKHLRALRELQAQFKQRSVHKEYLALLEGSLEPRQGRITAHLGRHPDDRKRQAVLPADTERSHARAAVTDYTTMAIYTVPLAGATAVANFTLVRAIPHTGRTHQLRVHFAWLKHPIVGDTLYGYRRQRLPTGRLFLHAHRLRFRLPSTGAEMEFVAPLPPELASVLDRLHAQTENG
jgi:23S rRNA pseudouridine1911/1915/1917 synthase